MPCLGGKFDGTGKLEDMPKLVLHIWDLLVRIVGLLMKVGKGRIHHYEVEEESLKTTKLCIVQLDYGIDMIE